MTNRKTTTLPYEMVRDAGKAIQGVPGWSNLMACPTEVLAREMAEAAITASGVPGLLAEVERLRSALEFVMTEIDGFVGVDSDRYDFAADVSIERGHEEPTAEDELDGFLRLVKEARRVPGCGGKSGFRFY